MISMAKKKPVGIEREIQTIIIRRLCTDDPAERRALLDKLVEAESRRVFMNTMRGHEYLIDSGYEIR